MNHFAKAVDDLDAAVFSGDELFDTENRELLRWALARWQRALATWDKLATEVEADEEDEV